MTGWKNETTAFKLLGILPSLPTVSLVTNRANELRELLAQLKWSQRQASRALEVGEREFRSWCAGKDCPIAIVLALKQLLDNLQS